MMTVGGELLFPDVSKGVGLTGFLSIHCNRITGHEHVSGSYEILRKMYLVMLPLNRLHSELVPKIDVT